GAAAAGGAAARIRAGARGEPRRGRAELQRRAGRHRPARGAVLAALRAGDRGMKVAVARLTPFALPLRAPLVTARAAIAERRGLLVELESADGRVGLGEATPPFGDVGRDLLAFAFETARL